jgi:hypothetical protein
LSELANQSAVFCLRHAVAAARDLRELGSIPNRDEAALCVDQSSTFKHLERQGDARAADTEHQREKIVDERQIVSVQPIRNNGYTIWNGGEWRMDATNEAGTPVFTLRFSADNYASD